MLETFRCFIQASFNTSFDGGWATFGDLEIFEQAFAG